MQPRASSLVLTIFIISRLAGMPLIKATCATSRALRCVSFEQLRFHILSIRSKIADPVTYGETEWISVLFHGQSFMLHQVGDAAKSLKEFMTICLIDCEPSTFRKPS